MRTPKEQIIRSSRHASNRFYVKIYFDANTKVFDFKTEEKREQFISKLGAKVLFERVDALSN